jgi:hypothetical protein
MRDIFILNEIWAQDKTIKYFGRNFPYFKYFTYHSVAVLAPNCKKHIVSPAGVRRGRF